jgi:ribosomal protein S18 acetylase RimI-like enzyme
MILIRPAADNDRHLLVNLIARIENFTSEEKELAMEVINDGLASTDSGYHILVAVDSSDHSLSGFICFGAIPITVDRWDLYWIAVDPRKSGQGVGSLLLRTMEDKLGEGVRIYIDTSSLEGYRKARFFYERHGYQPVCMLSDFYKNGDDKIIYCKELARCNCF